MIRRHRPKGLTLLELLVVTAIVASLSALMLPAVQSSREASRRAVCQAHLRQWALGAIRYADDHGGDLPRRGQGVQPTERFDRPDDWFNALPPYLESPPLEVLLKADKNVSLSGVWTCPTLPPADRPQHFAYGMNMWLSTSKGAQPDNIKAVGPLSTMVFMADGPGAHCSVLPAKKPYSPDPRHAGSVNLAFLDGHVVTIAGDEAGCGVGIPNRKDVRWIVPDSAWSGPDDH